MRRTGFLFFVVAIVGCGDSGDTSRGSCALGSELCGVYSVRTLLTNTSACTEPMQPVGLTSDLVVLYGGQLRDANDEPSESFLAAVFCSSVEICQEIAADAPSTALSYAFETSDGAQSEWIGFGAEGGAGGAGAQCSARVQEHTLSATSQGIRVETLIRDAVPFAPDENGVCIAADAVAATEGQPCREIIRLEAVFEEEL